LSNLLYYNLDYIELTKGNNLICTLYKSMGHYKLNNLFHNLANKYYYLKYNYLDKSSRYLANYNFYKS